MVLAMCQRVSLLAVAMAERVRIGTDGERRRGRRRVLQVDRNPPALYSPHASSYGGRHPTKRLASIPRRGTMPRSHRGKKPRLSSPRIQRETYEPYRNRHGDSLVTHANPTIPPSLSTRTMDRIRLRGTELTPHATFAPLHYEPGYAYPLVVWLHGDGGDERQVRHVISKVSLRNYVAIAPRGTSAMPADDDGYCWQQTAEAIEQAESRIFDCVRRPAAVSTSTPSGFFWPAWAAAARWRSARRGTTPADSRVLPRLADRCRRTAVRCAM